MNRVEWLYAQVLGRLPWFAAFFRRARRLRPVLPMMSSWIDVRGHYPSPGRSDEIGLAQTGHETLCIHHDPGDLAGAHDLAGGGGPG